LGEDENRRRCAEKKQGVVWSKFWSLHCNPSLHHLVCSYTEKKLEKNRGSVSCVQSIRVGPLPNLPHKVKHTGMTSANLCSKPSPGVLRLWKARQKRHFCPGREREGLCGASGAVPVPGRGAPGVAVPGRLAAAAARWPGLEQQPLIRWFFKCFSSPSK